MPEIIATATAFPPHYYSQVELVDALARARRTQFGACDERAVTRFFRAVHVEGRHLALELEQYFDGRGFGARNDAFIEVGLELGERVLRELLERAGLDRRDVALFASTTVTGIAVPSLDARLMNRLQLPPATKRLPLFGLGCVAGAAGIARLADYLRAYPQQAAILLSVELCSLTLQLGDLSATNIIASGLFGDGAAAVLLVGDEHPLVNGHPRVVDNRSVFFPDTERVMGWDVVDGGFQIVLDSCVPTLAKTALPRAVREFLGEHQLATTDIEAWIAHPGGPAVIDGMQQGLELPSDALALSRESLTKIGNLSSASVLVILDEALRRRGSHHHSQDGRALLLAMGPGFCAELVLLAW
jgi:alkylresorcinol/alkylpyrone synthase